MNQLLRNSYRSNLVGFLHPYRPNWAKHLISPFEYVWRPKKFRRIERLLYFREWAIRLMQKTRNPVYYDMIVSTYRKLRDFGVVVSDVGSENPKENP